MKLPVHKTVIFSAFLAVFAFSGPFIANAQNPVPSVSNIVPDTMRVGSPNFRMIVNGADFVPGAKVYFNGLGRTTTYVSPTQVTALVFSSLFPVPGSYPVKVVNPAPGGGPSNDVFFVATPRSPRITFIFPPYGWAGTTVLKIFGYDFHPTENIVQIGNMSIPNVPSNGNYLSLVIPASLLPGDYPISVTNVGGQSNRKTFRVVSFKPFLSSISPTQALRGDGDTVITVEGQDLYANTIVRLNGVRLPTTYISPTRLTAVIPAARLVKAGNFNITVITPKPGGGVSGPQEFTVANPTPAISSLSPERVAFGQPTFRITVNGNNFSPGAKIYFNGVGRTTAYVSPTQVTALVFKSLFPRVGSYPVTVVNPGPGGGSSNEALFFVE